MNLILLSLLIVVAVYSQIATKLYIYKVIKANELTEETEK